MFKDISSNAWYAKVVGIVARAGLMGGYPDGTFKPNGQITRAEVCSVLSRVGAPSIAKSDKIIFTDVKPGDWFYSSVMWAYANGWLKEFTETDYYGNTRFLPNFPISRAEMGHLLYNLLSIRNLTAASGGSSFRRQQILGTNMTNIANAGTQGRLTEAAWIAKEDKWAPKWSIPLFVDRQEVFDYPYTVVPAEDVMSVREVVSRRPVIFVAGGAAIVGLSAWLLLKK